MTLAAESLKGDPTFLKHVQRRNWVSLALTSLGWVLTVAALFPLFSVLLYVTIQGLPSLSLDFFTKLPAPVGEQGGMGNAVLGTLEMVSLASLFSVPIGILIATYLSELAAPQSKIAFVIRLGTDTLAGVPSIVVGVFAYALLVFTTKTFSALAGSGALAIIMLPLVIRTTEESLKLVPDSYRDGAYSLGANRFQAIFGVILPAARNGVITGALLAVSRAAGETAPLLFTALNNQYWNVELNQPMASLTVQLFTYAISPYEEKHAQAWAAALVLILFVLVFNVGVRFLLRSKF